MKGKPYWFTRRLLRRQKKDLSIVLVAYNMPRELPRTLLSLSMGYQRDVSADDFEVIVVDNGSDPPVNRKLLDDFPGNFRLLRMDSAPPSPAQAVNRGIAAAQGDIIGVMIDGARIATPGLANFARHGARLYPRAVVATLGWYLGHDYQRWAMRSGYDQAQEDALLAGIEWPKDGYRLFEIGTMDESSIEGWFQPIAESNAIFMQRALWEELGGMDERFDAPGGGLVNLDIFRRAIELRDTRLVVPLGEATFHQIHAGVATNLAVEKVEDAWVKWAGQYEMIRGRPYDLPRLKRPPTYVGTLPRPVLSRMLHAAISPLRHHVESPLGRGFDLGRWTCEPPVSPTDPRIAALVELAYDQFRCEKYDAAVAIARLIRNHAPDEPESLRLLSLVPAGPDHHPTPGPGYFLALGEAYRLLGENEPALVHYRKALALMHGALNMVSNDWAVVEARLKARGILAAGT